MSSPTRGATESETGWQRSLVRVWAVRMAAYLIPLLGGWASVHLLADHLWRPAGRVGFIVWAAQAMIIATAAAAGLERGSRRLLPLGFLFELSLTFPDEAPSRFRIALRSGMSSKIVTTKEASRSLEESASNGDLAGGALSLLLALTRHDRMTRGHTERVRAYADLIAKEMSLSKTERGQLAWGVLLHDVGKLTVPEAILNKKTPLTESEWEVLSQHPKAGAQIAAPLSSLLGNAAGAVGQHHERWDGAGYPNGLAGREISLAARITAVADSYDVITAARSYKKPMSHTAARQEMMRCSGSQFDPDVVRAMLNVSLGRRWRVGPLAWLAEIPYLARAGVSAATVPTAVATGLMVTAASAPPTGLRPPETVAFVDAEAVSIVGSGATTAPEELILETPSTETPSTSLLARPSTSEPGSTPPGRRPTTSSVPGETSTTLAPEAPVTTIRRPPSESPTTSVSTTLAPRTAEPDPAPPTTADAPPIPAVLLYLTNPGSGDTESSSPLPLSDSSGSDSDLPNYDTDRSNHAGLKIRRGRPAQQDEANKHQDWEITIANDISASRHVSLTLWVRPDKKKAKSAAVDAELYLCSSECALLAEGSWDKRKPSKDWTEITIDFGQVQVDVNEGDTLRLRLTVPKDDSDKSMRVAYDTQDFPSRLSVD